MPVESLTAVNQLKCCLLSISLLALLSTSDPAAPTSTDLTTTTTTPDGSTAVPGVDLVSLLERVLHLLTLSMSDRRAVSPLTSSPCLASLLHCLSALHVRITTQVSVSFSPHLSVFSCTCRQCFDAAGSASGRASSVKRDLALAPHAGSEVVRIDPLHFLAACHKMRLNQALSVLSLSVGFL